MIVKRMARMFWRAWLSVIAFTVPVVLGMHLSDLAARYNLGWLAVVIGIGGFASGAALCFALWDEWADQEIWP